MALVVSALTAAVLALWHTALSLMVIKLRRGLKVGLGDGGHDVLNRAIRAQANASEYIPIGLVLLVCLELNGAPMWLPGILAIAFVAGRVMHAIGIRTKQAAPAARVFGMVLTLTTILLMGFANLLWLFLNLQ
jgi:uncharacterized membrane protein YecN with MAPEG domain